MITPMPPTQSDRTGSDPRAGRLDEGFTLIELMVVLLIIAILLAIAIPTFLGVANSAGNRAAQSNLTNALTEAKAIYQNSAEYATTSGGTNTVLPIGTFTASAPEFSWVQGAAAATGGCFSSSNSNCVSEQVVDAAASGDAQGIVLAVYSPKTQTCWYAVDLESTPVSIATDTGYVPFITTGHVPTTTATGGWTAGVFYAKKTSAVSGTNCNAYYAVATAATFGWGQSYSSPGAAG
jgi:prepilin-type N-terminal cleavage/methylation domain-containing protein